MNTRKLASAFIVAKTVFFTSFKFFVNGTCIAFVIWQTIGCLTKYAEKLQGTRVQMKKSSLIPFPAITVCGLFVRLSSSKLNIGYNST